MIHKKVIEKVELSLEKRVYKLEQKKKITVLEVITNLKSA